MRSGKLYCANTLLKSPAHPREVAAKSVPFPANMTRPTIRLAALAGLLESFDVSNRIPSEAVSAPNIPMVVGQQQFFHRSR